MSKPVLPVDFVLDAQSGTLGDANITPASTTEEHQNVSFVDQNENYNYYVESEEDPTRTLQDMDDATLDDFFMRPLKIADIPWDSGTFMNNSFDPWEAYFTNPRVINRLTNYKLMRAKLNLKIIVNGNGFWYGRAIGMYLPLDDKDAFSNVFTSLNDIVQGSQCPHLFINPTASEGGEMELPFFYQRNYVDIPTNQFRELGRFYIKSFDTLKHANEATGRVNVSVFAWASDVSLSILTSRDASTLVPQSGKMKKTKSPNKSGTGKKPKSQSTKGPPPAKEVDEANSKGIISGPATTISKIASALTVVPQLAPFAMATSKVAGTVASVASIFGYSRPPVTKNPEPYRAQPISSLATTTVPDTAMKLTVDDKQELTIDPRISGMGSSDPMNIKTIASRESFLTQFDWSTTNDSETFLWNMRLDPVTWAETAGPPRAYHFPACAMAALPFKYWTGTMKIRFQIVASTFHKGRLKFVYDPDFLASNEYNTNYIEIVDISEEQDFTIEIGNGQEETLLEHHLPGLESATQMYSTTPYASKEQGNGVLGVYVVNSLTSPSSDAQSVKINVYVSMGDDFEVFVPDRHFQNFVLKPQTGVLEPQSGMNPDATNTSELDTPNQEQSMQLGPGEQDTALVNKVFTGEAIASFRPLLKRYNLWRRDGFTFEVTTALKDYTVQMSNYPFLRGNVTGAVDEDSLGNPYNFVNTVLIHWVTYAFSGWRGSIRYKIITQNLVTGDTAGQSSRGYVERLPDKSFGQQIYKRTSIVSPGAFTKTTGFSSSVMPGATNFRGITGTLGAALMSGSVNPNLEFEVPYYAPHRFTPGKIEDWTSGTDYTWTPNWIFNLSACGENNSTIDYLVGTGEDFQVYFFTGLPRMYFELTPPPP